MLVSVIIVSVLVGSVLPVMIGQVYKFRALQVARDLTHLRLSILQFHADVRDHPLRLTQTAYPITAADTTLKYRATNPTPTLFDPEDVERWHGPYMDAPLAEQLADEDAIKTGLGAWIGNDIYCIDVKAVDVSTTCKKGDWIGLLLFNVRIAEFERINAYIDPSEKNLPRNDKVSKGKLIFRTYGSIAESSDPGDIFFLVMPYLKD